VYAVVASFLIPAVYEIYNKFMDNGKSVMDKDYDTVNMQDEKAERGRMTPEDIAKRA